MFTHYNINAYIRTTPCLWLHNGISNISRFSSKTFFFLYIFFPRFCNPFHHPCMFLWGYVVRTQGDTGRTCKLHTERSYWSIPTFCGCGRRRRRVWDTPPAPTSSPSGNRTQDLLAVRRRGTRLRHRASRIGSMFDQFYSTFCVIPWLNSLILGLHFLVCTVSII